MDIRFRSDPAARSSLRHALNELAKLTDKDDSEGMQQLVRQSARRFVKNVAAITPPATGTLDHAAKRRGEAAILGDLLKLAIPVSGELVSRRGARAILASAEQLLAANIASRRGTPGGRVNPRNRRKLLISQRDFTRVAKRLQGNVGMLAAGLNAAAEALGFRLPAWIARHGARYGSISVTASEASIRIRIVQAVPFADDVAGYRARWEAAYARELRTVQQMMEVLWGKAFQRSRKHLRR